MHRVVVAAFDLFCDLDEFLFLQGLGDLDQVGGAAFLAATIVPFSSDILYVAMLQMTAAPWACLAVATAGNWLGSLTSLGLGWLGKWEWLERWFKVDRAKLEKQKVYVDRYGVWLALVSWLPFVGDLFSIALGFYKTNPWLTALLMLLGKFLRFLFWNLLLGAF